MDVYKRGTVAHYITEANARNNKVIIKRLLASNGVDDVSFNFTRSLDSNRCYNDVTQRRRLVVECLSDKLLVDAT